AAIRKRASPLIRAIRPSSPCGFTTAAGPVETDCDTRPTHISPPPAHLTQPAWGERLTPVNSTLAESQPYPIHGRATPFRCRSRTRSPARLAPADARASEDRAGPDRPS